MAVNFFKRVTARELTTYVPFNRNTRGISGRAVYINPELLPRYIELVSGKAVIQMRLDAAIQGLRALAGGFSSASNTSNGFSHRIQVDGVVISYAILQGGAPSIKGGVYVTDLRIKGSIENMEKAGLNKATSFRDRWSVVPAKENMPDCADGVIASGPTKAYEPVNGRYSNDIIQKGLERSRNEAVLYSATLVKSKTTRTASTFNFFYVPAGQVDCDGSWRTPSQKWLSSNGLAAKLAQAMANKDIRSKTSLTWHVSDYGAGILLQALKLLPSYGVTKLKNQHFTLSNPLASVTAIQSALESYGVELKNDKVEINKSSLGSLAYQSSIKATLPSAKNAESIARPPKVQADTNFAEVAHNLILGASRGWA